MSNTVVRVAGLSKQYRIGRRQEKYRTLRDTLADAFTAPFRRAGQLLRGQAYGAAGLDETIWALQDVSFEVSQGEVVGIIGRNGAGKSTLLKVLSRITEPTHGYAEVRGRVGSLLEVGTGFHPELTGRENIYLNGAILGMSRQEIARKFDEIVAFAEVDRFIDTPVKHYSSGMGLRLGFAVAAHLEPDILVVDEVLAVGDAAFQKKCLGKMDDVAGQGRTVLFVSHNMVAVQGLCQSALLLEQGRLTFRGDTNQAINLYLVDEARKRISDLSQRTDRKGDQALTFTAVDIFDGQGSPINHLFSGQHVCFRFSYQARQRYTNANVVVSLTLYDQQYQLINLNSEDSGDNNLDIQREGYFECDWPLFNLAGGTYTCGLFCSINGHLADWVESAFVITVENGDFFGTGKLIPRQRGKVLAAHRWRAQHAE